MKIPSGDPEKAQPHHGLLILGIGAVIASLLSSLPAGSLSFTPGKVEDHGRCVYQLFLDDVCHGIVALKGPETLAGITRAFGVGNGTKGDSKIACGTAIRIWSDPPRHSLEKIAGAYLIMADQRIDINCADASDLQAVPGIGPVLAERMVRYRRRHGPFGEVRELTNIGGISRKRVQALEPYLRAGNSRCDALQYVETGGLFVHPSVGGDQKEATRRHEIGKSDSGGY